MKIGVVRAAWPAALFFFLTILMTWPQSLGMGSRLGDPYNSLQGAYCVGEGSKIWTHPVTLLESRFLFPHARTMLNNMLVPGIYLIAGPVYLASGNPVLAYNFYILLYFFLNGWCMYLLARHLLWGAGPAVVAGFVYAFCPFRFSAPQLVGTMANFWACLVLLALHEFVVSGGMRFLPCAIFGFCFGMLCISDIFSGLVFFLMVALFLAWHALRGRLRLRGRTLAGLAAACAIATLIVAPLIMTYVLFSGYRGTSDMTRGIEETQILSCDAKAYLAAPPTNALYGGITKRYRLIGAQYLFPGLIAGALCIIGVFRRHSRLARSGERGFLILIGIAGVLISFGPAVYVFGHKLCPGPYLLLYYLVPGFKSLRGIGWTVILAIIPFALFCGEGASSLLDRMGRSRGRALLLAAILVGLFTEYYNRNAAGDYFTALNAPVSTQPLPVYRWLKQQPGEFGVIELPMPADGGEFESAGHENEYMRWSLYHGKRIVNGYASFRPPEYWPLADLMAHFPAPETIDVLRALGVRYVIVHADWYDYDEDRRLNTGRGTGRRVVEDALRLPDELVPSGRFGSSWVFAPAPGKPAPGGGERADAAEIPPERGWRVTANIHPDETPRIFDRNPATAWDIMRGFDVYNNGNRLQVDFGRPIELSRIAMDYRGFREYPRGLEAEVSADGIRWERLETLGAYRDLVVSLLRNPRERTFELSFPARKARYLRLTQTLPSECWSISELRLYAPRGGGTPRGG
ncbi:MAG: discoidin domain-containing protein [Chlamydiota bacterium]